MLCAPRFDLPTNSSSGFLIRYVLPRLALPPAPPPLVGPLARNPFFSLFVPYGDLLIGSGHGSRESWSGQNEDMLLTVGQYDPAQVRGKVIKLVSCDCGAELLPDLVQNKAKCAMGYDSDLLWIADPLYRFNPWDDEDVKMVMGPIVVAGLNALLDGATCAEAFAIEKAGLLANAANTDFELLRALLEYDADHAVLFGDASATIIPRPKISLPFPPPPLLF